MYTITELKKVRNDFRLRGETIKSWSIKEGFKTGDVYAVLSGRNKGERGQAHEIAVRLGLIIMSKHIKTEGVFDED